MGKVKITEQGVRLPDWTDASSVVAWLTMLLGIVVSFLSIVRPGLFGVAAQADVRQIIPIAGVIIAAIAGFINSHRIAKVTIQVIANAHAILTMSRTDAKNYGTRKLDADTMLVSTNNPPA